RPATAPPPCPPRGSPGSAATAPPATRPARGARAQYPSPPGGAGAAASSESRTRGTGYEARRKPRGQSAVDRAGSRAGVLGVRDQVVLEAGLGFDLVDPTRDVGRQLEPRVGRGMRVPVDREVGERVGAAGEERAAGEAIVEQLEHRAAAGEAPLELGFAALVAPGHDP